MSERLDLFLKSITDYADTQCKKLQKTAETQTQKEITTYKKQATEVSRANTNREIAKLKSSAAGKAADYEAQKRLNLAKIRNELSNDVFDEVANKITAFSKSPEYLDFLKRSAKSLKEVIGEDIIFYVKPDDLQFANVLLEVATKATVKESSKIHFGGLIATDKDENLRADDTLDSRLKSAQSTFFENADFKIF